MKNVSKQLFLPMLLLCGLPSFSATACAILTKEGAAERHQQYREEFKKAASAIKEEADLVFVGRLSKLTFSKDTVKSPSGQEQILQTHQAIFSVDQAIKGQYMNGQVLEYTINKNRITIGCTKPFIQFPKETGTGETYLVYAKEGKILRTNHIPNDAQVLSGREEAAFIGEQQ